MTKEIQCPIREQGLCIAVIKVTEKTENLIGWQKMQNGKLEDIHRNVNTLREYTQEKLDDIRDRMETSASKFQWWLIGLLATALLAVALLAVNIARGIV